MVFDRERSNLEGAINKLRDDVEFNQVNFIREKDRNVYLSGDFEK